LKFWDSSAIVPAFIREARTEDMRALQELDGEVWVWWATRPECMAVIARLAREGRFSAGQVETVRTSLRQFFGVTREVPPSEPLRLRAERLLAVHALRTADALQLAAALIWSREQPAGHGFVSLDRRLRDAGQREGFTILPLAL
jgi:predicted nucleic acid-binding protein